VVTAATPVASVTARPEIARNHTWISSNWADAALVAGITVLAAILRLQGIAARELWFDETLSVGVAKMPWPHLFLTLWYREANGALYFLLLHFWLALGTTPGIIRGLSALFGVATVPVTYALGARFFGRKTGLIAAWFLALNAFHIRYSQEARGYSMVVFFGALATWLLLRNLEEPASAHWGLYAVACAAAVYSHMFGLLVVVVHGLSLTLPRRPPIPWRDIARSMFWFSCLVLPLGIFSLRSRTTTVDWIPPTQPDTILNFWRDLAGNSGYLLVGFEVLAIIASAVPACRALRGENQKKDRWTFALLFAWLFVPPAIAIAASWMHPIFLSRYLIICLPALGLLASFGITQVRPAVLASLLLAFISGLSLFGAVNYHQREIPRLSDGWSAASSYVFNQAQPGDGVYFYMSTGHIPFEYYRSQRHPTPMWPQPLDSTTGMTLTPSDFQFLPIAERLSDTQAAGDRVWLVLQYDTVLSGLPDKGSNFVRGYFARGRQLAETKRFVGVTVQLFSRASVGTSQVAAVTP
jgi:mannosyltransferase